MKVFVVTIGAGEEALGLASRLVREAGIENYADAEDFWPDGVQDPYRAVDDVDALVWIYRQPSLPGEVIFGMSDYNYLFGDTVMQRAVRTGKPILYYSYASEKKGYSLPSPAILGKLARRSRVSTIQELEAKLKEDLHDLALRR